MHKGKNLRKSKEKSKYRESKKMHKKHMFLNVFQKIMLFACVFCAFFVSPVFATLPAGYTELEYIENDGHSYLILPYIANNKTVLYCRYNELQNGFQVANAIFGVTDSPDVAKANNGVLRLTGSNFNRMGWGDAQSGSVKDVSAPKEFNTWYEVLYDQNKLYLNNVLYATSATSNNTVWSANYGLGVFARNGSSVTMVAYAKISSLWAKEGGDYKLNLIPARRNSDNVLGMYDTVSGTFFENAGTGDFIAGPEVVIKIATTKMVDEEFAAAEAKLAATVQTIESVVSRTITQTGQIQVLQDTKQTRPDETCPANMKCLLVQDEDGTPHWYPIIEP
ncbi:MAG: hypothetical protein MJ164_00560 [Alphaproteobacteria bacterium]|nr:hypothetical protein [Alphaproteobacteria bacterium]